MTKAEAFVSHSPLWRQEWQRKEDHKSMADTYAICYMRYNARDDNFAPIGEPTHRLVCYSSHGDSILWEHKPENAPQYKWQLFNARSLPFGDNNEGNVEYAYDEALKDLV